MAKQLGRWRMIDAFPPIGARPGAYLASPVDDLARLRAAERRATRPTSPRQAARAARHIHINLPGRRRRMTSRAG